MRSGFASAMSEVMRELTTNHAAHERMATAVQNPDNADVAAILKDIRAIRKGRFAQRLASVIDESADATTPPVPIAEALAYLLTKVSAG
jgi:hypothetical protein